MARVTTPQVRRRDEGGWAFPVLLLTTVLVLLVILIVLLVRGSSVAPSAPHVENRVLQLWKTVASPSNAGNDFVTCDYRADQWAVGYSFGCTIWSSASGAPEGATSTARLTVQDPPSYDNGPFASVLFGDGTGPYLVHF